MVSKDAASPRDPFFLTSDSVPQKSWDPGPLLPGKPYPSPPLKGYNIDRHACLCLPQTVVVPIATSGPASQCGFSGCPISLRPLSGCHPELSESTELLLPEQNSALHPASPFPGPDHECSGGLFWLMDDLQVFSWQGLPPHAFLLANLTHSTADHGRK